MDISVFRSNFPLLLQYMRANNYNSKYIRFIQTEINWIFSNFNENWSSLEDACQERLSQLKNGTRPTARSIFTLLNRFIVSGQFPDGKKHASIINKSSYHQLLSFGQFKHVIDTYIRIVSNRKTEKTIISEVSSTAAFFLAFEKQEIYSLAEIEEDHVLNYFKSQNGKTGNRTPAYMYLHNEATTVPIKKVPKKKINGLSKAAVKALLSVPDTTTLTGIRDLVLMLVLYSTAARIDEVLSIQIKHIFLKTSKPYINIIGKGNKARTLTLLPKVVTYIEKYLRICHECDSDPEAYLFYSKIKGPHVKLTQPAVDKRLKAIAATARNTCSEVPVRLHAHQFRHAKATHWLEDGINIVQISFLLGHENVETTMKYLDITLDSERKALQTLENESERKIKPKWKSANKSLKSFCGI